MMRFMRCIAVALVSIVPIVGQAQERAHIGSGRIFNNDILGDGHDRWRTGSSAYSRVYALNEYSGQQTFGDIIEYRLRTEIITAERGSAAPGDRPYVGAVSLGAHTHFTHETAQISLGLDLVTTGPQTGLSDFQEWYHDAFSIPDPQFVDQQFGNAFFLNAVAEIRGIANEDGPAAIRPFIEATLGPEDILRLGFDVMLGGANLNALRMRDVVTGQLYPVAHTPEENGFTYSFGADFGRVFDSRYLQNTAREQRSRLRAGVQWPFGSKATIHYGATYLSPEFIGQAEGQVVGSLQLHLNF